MEEKVKECILHLIRPMGNRGSGPPGGVGRELPGFASTAERLADGRELN